MPSDILPGRSFPLGATVFPEGVNFCVMSKNSYALELLLFDDVDDGKPARVIRLDPRQNRTFYYWHVFVQGIKAGQLYGYRAYGPHAPERGLRFDGDKVLLDPYARAVAVGKNYDRAAAARPGDNAAHAMKSVVVNLWTYDWEDDRPLNRPFSNTVIYEMHVGGFTRHPNAGVAPEKRGTYAGLIEKIPYLKALGVTAVQLQPVQQFDEQDAFGGRANYWGYSPIGFFAPHSAYSSQSDPLGPVNEFRDMVKALHRAGIEVILDVVFNHTAEGDHHGPTLSFRGLANRAYYLLDKNRALYADYTGTGNTLNANQSIVRRLIRKCLRYWVSEMHVDGFRFDLASVMSRDEEGRPLKSPPILWSIESEPTLAGTKIIAEAWDAGGLYQVGSFVGDRWAELNGKFRDDVRRFVKSDTGTVPDLAARIAASPDLYPQPDRGPNRSINFITSHDGFTLADLVSYNQKHNLDNGEDNRDGDTVNHSWNHGIEGPTDDPGIEALRLRQIKNFLTVLLTAQGTPMLLMGDEVRRTQRGNNNAYAQDNEISWFDWDLVEKNAGLLRFARGLIHLNQNHQIFQQHRFWKIHDGDATPDLAGPPPVFEPRRTRADIDVNREQDRLWHEEIFRMKTEEEAHPARIVFHGTHLHQPDTSDHSHSLAYELYLPENGEHLHVILNAYWEPLSFELPWVPNEHTWRRLVDTARPAPDDFYLPADAPPVTTPHYRAEARSAVVLAAGPRR